MQRFQGRALEEIDAIFKVKFNPFHPTVIPYTSAELRVGQLEGEKIREKEAVSAVKGAADNDSHVDRVEIEDASV